MDLDISPLERAVARLQEAIAIYQQDRSQSLIRDGLIQRFEFTYDIAHRILRRYLAANTTSSDLISGMPFADIIRLGNENNLLLGDWPRWKTYRDMRSRTSHSYNEATALDVVAGIPGFLDEVRYVRDRLIERLTE